MVKLLVVELSVMKVCLVQVSESAVVEGSSMCENGTLGSMERESGREGYWDPLLYGRREAARSPAFAPR